MNTKLITKALNSLFQLTDEDRAIVLKLWSLSEVEREQLVGALSPQKATTTKKAGKKATKHPSGRCQAQLASGATCNMTASHGIHDHEQKARYLEGHEFVTKTTVKKSARATGMAAALNRSLESQREATKPRCTATVKGGNGDGSFSVCDEFQESPIHNPNGGYVAWHDFLAPESKVTSVGGD